VSRPIRFTFILGLAALATVFAAVGGWRFARASAPLNGPIIIVSIDSLRADRLPAYGYTGVRTPALDALAADGVVFERAYSHSPSTLPSHAAMLTGRLPFETGVRDNVGFTLKTSERSLAQMLRDRGYATGGVVSAFALRKATGIGSGFEFFDSDLRPDATGATTVGHLKRDGAASEAIAERWLTSVGSSRALLFLHLDEPHKPYVLPDRFGEYPEYDGAVAYSDEILGRLVRYLKSHQMYDRSTIVVLSDHGEGLGDHGEQQHGLFLYDEAIHVPLIVKQEGNAGAGRRVSSVVQHIDLVPTILELVKTSIPGGLRGRSLKPLLDGTGQVPARPVYSESLYARYQFGWSELVSVTDERYRYVKAPTEELYDLSRDPDERTNIARDPSAAAQLRTLRASLDRLTAGAKMQPPVDSLSADERDRLQALGYFGGRTLTPNAAGKAIADPKDPKDYVETVERYRAAIEVAGARRWRDAIGRLQQILGDDPEMPGLWSQLAGFALRIDRFDLAADAFKHYAALMPASPDGYLGAATALLKQRKLDEARAMATRAADVAADTDRKSRASAYEILARIAVARRDAEAARAEAARSSDEDPRVPVPAFIDARLLYEQGRFADALPLFEQALEQQKKTVGIALPDLHYYAADTYGRLDRYSEAETEFLAELHDFPYHLRARAGLATLYHTMSRDDEAASAIAEMTDVLPTPESYAAAARLWSLVGNQLQAEAIRAEMRERFADAPRSRSTSQ
jgi:choline-sulfatase